MSTSYLGWSVKLKGALARVEAHITLKYLGDVEVPISELVKRFKGMRSSFDLKPCYWAGEVFDKSYVMVIEGWDPALARLRFAVEDLRADDYPTWRPHITLDKSVWSFIVHGNLRPLQVVDWVGPLTLFVDKRPVKAFSNGTELVHSTFW